MVTTPEDSGPDTGPDTSMDDRQIPEPERRGERLAGLLVLGLAVLNFPLLSIFSVHAFFCGVPVLYIYLFSVWSLIIGVVAFVLRSSAGSRPESDKKPFGES
jgi:hypothetical protein